MRGQSRGIEVSGRQYRGARRPKQGPEPAHRVHNPDDGRRIDWGVCIPQIPKKSTPWRQQWIAQDSPEQILPFGRSRVLAGNGDQFLRRIDLIGQRHESRHYTGATRHTGATRQVQRLSFEDFDRPLGLVQNLH
jgi:hypothetical protein